MTDKPAQSDAPSAEPMTEFRKALNCLYIAVEAHVADDVVRRANAALEHLTKRAEAAESALSEARERAQKLVEHLQWKQSHAELRVKQTEENESLKTFNLGTLDCLQDIFNSIEYRLLAGASGAAGKVSQQANKEK